MYCGNDNSVRAEERKREKEGKRKRERERGKRERGKERGERIPPPFLAMSTVG